ncbi:MAG: 50S ribosomal protein L22 [Candidatus Portnoybacteria bacterium CG10_big_fil_rev_8_21_14_0_10_38_18]|uniref:Large ribosomal subunit protein uL22 n=1 Tax=Candidatus Portnoybacteria bacterium CG10_big_fil_rev_8_21_14_0_10_38_18 TaxID=1974813 RepID=A0A2M8KCH2_9BACT|nr:MAG: 50S ribosomal protein L22 [Candidatus Portnoybacteria bacterium CG10_big_fil_rev_8_21_14_0_10_38_18]
MEIKAKLSYLRISPRKVRGVTEFIKGMQVKQAESHLKFIPKRVSRYLLGLLQSAVSNAQNNFKADKDSLYIKEITVNEGSPFKRSRPVSRGRAFPIMKRTSNINLILESKPAVAKASMAKKAAETEKKPAEKAEPIQAGPPKSKGFGGKPKSIKPKAPKEIVKGSKIRGLTQKIFRRKSF